MLLSLRPARAADAAAVRDWFLTREEAAEWAGDSPWPLPLDWMARTLTLDREPHFVLADALDGPVGLFGLRLHQDRAHLIRVALAPTFRGVGFSARLLEAAFSMAAELGHTFMTLMVMDGNSAARGAYEKADFAYIRGETGRFGQVWWMGRSLEPEHTGSS